MFYTWQLRLASEAGTHVAQGPVQSDCRGPASPSVAVMEWGEHVSLSAPKARGGSPRERTNLSGVKAISGKVKIKVGGAIWFCKGLKTELKCKTLNSS